MTVEQVIYLAIAAIYFFTIAQALASLWEGIHFDSYVKVAVENAPSQLNSQGRFKFQPRAAVILPCCGVDEKLHKTVEALAQQNYDDFEVIFTFESATDPAYPAIESWTKNWTRPHRLITAGPTTHRSQKIHNLLAAVQVVSPDREALLFLDSDAIPGRDWLGYLVAPLADQSVGATTGYRWYTASSDLPSQIRSAWNAATVTLLADERKNFCWGGATALLKSTYDRCNVNGAWENALSDDYQLSHAIKFHGLRIRFVPQAMVPSSDRTTLRDFWSFAKRQIVITRICGPKIWRSAFLLCFTLVLGGTAVALLFGAGLIGWASPLAMWLGFAAWMSILATVVGKAAFRQRAVRRVLGPPDIGPWDRWADLGVVSFSGLMFTALMLSSLTTRRFFWRNIEYEMVAADQTRVIGRK